MRSPRPGFGFGEPQRPRCSRLARKGVLVDFGADDLERDLQPGEQFATVA